MPEALLRLSRRIGPPRPADAWYAPSAAAAEWVDVVASWKVDHQSVAILPLSRDGADRAPAGALLIPPAGAAVTAPRCVPFARVAPDFYIPADAELVPPLEPGELAALVAADYVHVWMPGAGLTAAEPHDLLHVGDLVRPGTRRATNWDNAVPGVAHPHRLSSIEPIVAINLQSIFDEGRGDIGADAGEPDKLPPSPREPTSSPLGAAASAAAAVGGAALVGMMRMLARAARAAKLGRRGEKLQKPRTPPQSGASGAQAGAGSRSPSDSGGGFGRYLSDQLNRAARALAEARHRELSRLLNLLEHDPDQGLRFAIPFSGGGGHRGRARPGARLMERLVEFSMRALGGGGPADFWDVPANYQLQLQAKYRELANREMRLGRHRRAAYIFAQLLSDFESAASALRDGRHFREAAIIYRDRLKRPLDAARSYEQGGLWAEAIAEYQQLEMHEQVGDLYLRIDDRERAVAAFDVAHEAHGLRADFLGAARIAEEKLLDVDLAAEDLEMGWLSSQQSLESMRGLFALFGRHGRHADATQRAHQLATDAAESKRTIPIANLLADFAESYPEADVREAARECARIVIGRRLPTAAPGEADAMCRTLVRLAPDDRLLESDARRYATRLQTRSAITRSASPGVPGVRIVASWAFGLPGAWRTAAAGNTSLLLAGIMDKRLMIARSTLAGSAPQFAAPWPAVPVHSEAPLLLIADRLRDDALAVHALGGSRLSEAVAFVQTDELPKLVVGAVRGANAPLGAANDAQGVTWVAEDRNGMTIAGVDREGRLISTRRLPLELADDPDHFTLPLPMVAREGRLYVGLGANLVTIEGDGDPVVHEMPDRIVSLCATPHHTQNRIAVGLTTGAQLVWDGSGRHHARPFATDMSVPVLGFNRGGYVVAACGARYEVYDTKDAKLTQVAAGSHAGGNNVIAVFALPAPNRFGLVDQSGKASVYEISHVPSFRSTS